MRANHLRRSRCLVMRWTWGLLTAPLLTMPLWALPGCARQAATAETSANTAYASGVKHLDSQEWKPAIEAFSKAVELAPDVSSGYEGLGYTYAAIGRKDLAMKEYEILKDMNPKDADWLLKEINKQ
jgi:tetratricopeptide (TPR) repeat protein